LIIYNINSTIFIEENRNPNGEYKNNYFLFLPPNFLWKIYKSQEIMINVIGFPSLSSGQVEKTNVDSMSWKDLAIKNPKTTKTWFYKNFKK